MSNKNRLIKRDALNTIGIVFSTIFMGELLVMLILQTVTNFEQSPLLEALIDAGSLAFICTPIISLWVLNKANYSEDSINSVINVRTKGSAYSIFSVSIILALLITFIYTTIARNNLDSLKHHQAERLTQLHNNAQNIISNIRADLNYFSNLPSIKTALLDNPFYLDQVSITLQQFAQNHPEYFQIRLLNFKGLEKIRIDHDSNTGVSNINKSLLQNKEDRYYFRETIKLSKYEYYLSPFDLNIENGKVQLPRKPTVRLSQVIFDDQNNKIGIMIFNYLADDLLEKMRSEWKNEVGDFQIINDQGFWLINPNRENEWGFMFPDKKNLNFKTQMPTIWKKLEEAQFITPSGDIYSTKLFSIIDKDKSPLWLISHISNQQKSLLNEALKFQLLILYFCLLIPSVIFILIIIRTRQRKEIATEQLLKQQKQNFEILNSINETFIAVDSNWVITHHNLLSNTLVTNNSENITGNNLWDIFPELASFFYKQANSVMKTHQTTVIQGYYPPKDNWLESRIYPMKNGLSIYFMDISKEKKSLEKLRRHQDQMAEIFNKAPLLISIKDTQGKYTFANTGFSEATKLDISDIINNTDQQLFSVEQANRIKLLDNKSLKSHQVIQSEENDLVPGNNNTYLVNRFKISNPEQGRSSLCTIAADITPLRESQKRFDFLAHHDPLTSLPNRILFNDRLKHAISKAKREGTILAIMFIDLDRFKYINDTHGHPTGDKLLIAVAQSINSLIRNEDTVARLGGDEFIVLLENMNDRFDASRIAQIIIQDLSNTPIETDKYLLSVTASIGISLYPEDGINVTSLIKNADTAMYDAKDKGRNNFSFYTSALTKTANERILLENDLKQAIKLNELSLHYQPQIDIRNKNIIGMECLLRWNHTTKGMISPFRFIPIAEESGLILEIGEWVLKNALNTANQWYKEGLLNDISISINLSARQIFKGDLNHQISTLMSEIDLPVKNIELEITESAVMQFPKNAENTLKQLKEQDISLALDDFGTGYSSLSYLKRFPIDRLKIDRSFIRDIPGDLDDKALTKAIIAMAHSLDIHVIAEGVETIEQSDFLKQNGCYEIQGFLYYKPMAEDKIKPLLIKQRNELVN